MSHRTTLTQFIVEKQGRIAGSTGDFTGLLNEVTLTCKAIANAVNRGDFVGVLGEADTGPNVWGETQKKLELIANEFVDYHQEAARGAA
jgi:fructose-1,6-bisphosphatase I